MLCSIWYLGPGVRDSSKKLNSLSLLKYISLSETEGEKGEKEEEENEAPRLDEVLALAPALHC